MWQLLKRRITPRVLQVGLAVAIGLAIPATAVLAKGPDASGKGQEMGKHLGWNKSGRVDHGKPDKDKPDKAGKPDDTGEPTEDEDTENGDRPHNHGWYVSQAAHADYASGRAHGEAVSAVAQSDQGK